MYPKAFELLVAPFVGGSLLLGLVGFIAIPSLSILAGGAVLSFETERSRESYNEKTPTPIVLVLIGLIEGAVCEIAVSSHLGVDYGRWFLIVELAGLAITVIRLLPYGLFRTIQGALGGLLWGFAAFSVAFIALAFVNAGLMVVFIVVITVYALSMI